MTTDNLKAQQDLAATKKNLATTTGQLLQYVRQNFPQDKFVEVLDIVREKNRKVFPSPN